MVEVILIDDDEMTRTALRLLLREALFEVVGEARDGVSGLALVERLQPGIVCLDIQMPGKDGLEVLAEIKSGWPSVAVLMVTASADPASVKKALALGADGFVVKPFNPDRVVKSLRSVVRGAKPARAAASKTGERA